MPARLLTPADIPAYIALRREMLDDAPWAFAASPADDAGLDPAVMASRLTEPFNVIAGLFDDGRLIGTAGIFRPRHAKMSHRANIWGVYISPAARGRGHGAAVVSTAIDAARSWPGVNSVGLSASVRSEAAIRLYRRLGFTTWGREPGALVLDGLAYDEIHMVLFLDMQVR